MARVKVVKSPKTVGAAMLAAAESLGPTMFCSDCYGWVNTWHVCSFPMGRRFVPTVVTLEGGLAAEELEPMSHDEAMMILADRWVAQDQEVAS